MPIYEYRCSGCGHHLEALQKMAEAPLRKCPECGKSQLKRLVSASQFRLKGSGWYETDFKNKSETQRNLVGRDSSEAASDKSTDTAAKDEAGKAVAAVKAEGDAASKPANAKPASEKPASAKPTAVARSKSASKSRAKAARR
ncbi:MAG TPA: zinc ribbon domain-containing protein [Gammaproteobacteria bacterium]|jgi:putative FmdB family regulatory protein|nr:zinc ribbon domain-containing protein [Gammaproteobacteria bacterium]